MKNHNRCSFLQFFAAVFLLSVAMSANAASVSGQGTWESTLQGRDLDGNATTFEVYYDTELNITWLADANLAASNTFGVTGIAGSTLEWDQANEWISAMNSYGGTGYLGINNWRQPTVRPVNGISFTGTTTGYDGSTDNGYNISASGTAFAQSTASEMAYMYYNTLGNTGLHDLTGAFNECSLNGAPLYCLTNAGPFSNLQASQYWTGIEDPSNPNDVYAFNLGAGGQGTPNKGIALYVWAVHDGDIAAVPIPAAFWLFGSGLIGLFGFVRRRVAYYK
jgi:hypothetical protein